MIFYIIIAVALAAVILPFIPGGLELRRRRDDTPLAIDLGHTKNPFFYGDSFRELLRKNDVENPEDRRETVEVKLSRTETIRRIQEPIWRGGPRLHVKTLLYVDGDLESGAESRFSKEIMVSGSAVIGPETTLRAILTLGRLTLGRGARVIRWVDVRGGDLVVEDQVDLGKSASVPGLLSLGLDTRFSNLYGLPVQVRAAGEPQPARPHGHVREKALVASDQLFSLPWDTRLENNIISKRNLVIGAGSVIAGDVKGARDVILEDGVTITGTLIAEGDIKVGPNCRIKGNVFSQNNVVLGSNCLVGGPDLLCSVVSKAGLELHPGVAIHGFVTCGRGRVTAAASDAAA